MEDNKNENFEVRDQRNGEFYWVNKLILDHPYLNPSTKLIYHALAYFANNTTQEAFPGVETIAKMTSLKRITVLRAIKQLEEYFFIKVIRTSGKKNRYVLLKIVDSKPVKKIYRYQKDTPPVSNGHRGGYQMGTTNNTNKTILNNNTKATKEKNDFLEVKKAVVESRRWGDIKARFPDRDYEFQLQKMVCWWNESNRQIKRPIVAFTNWLEKTRPDARIIEKRGIDAQQKKLEEDMKKADAMKATPEGARKKLSEMKNTLIKKLSV